jgi:signal peptidase I
MEPQTKIKNRKRIQPFKQIITRIPSYPRLLSAIAALILFFSIKIYFFDVVRINNNDMRESYFYGDVVLIKKFGQAFHRNDVLYFEYPVKDSTNKKTMLFQRIIGLPGDSVLITDKIVFVNDEMMKDSETYKQNYFIHLDSLKCDSTFAKQFSKFEGGKIEEDFEYGFSLTDKQFDSIEKVPCIKSIKIKKEDHESFDENCFPNSEHYRWNRDHYGKLYIPKKNDVLKLDTLNIDLYESIISYEQNQVELRNDSIFINAVYTNTYLVKSNYYFMMGDNRDNTVDSRIWGFLPESQIIGKVLFRIRKMKP